MIERFRPEEEAAARARYASQLHGAGVRRTRPAYTDEREYAWEAEATPEYDDYEYAEEAAEGEIDTHGEVEAKPSRRGKRITRIVAVLLSLGILAAAIIAVINFVNGPAIGTTSNELAKKQAAMAPKPEMAELTGKQITLKYPGIFDQVGNQAQNASEYDNYYLSSKGEAARGIAVAVVALPSNNIMDDSSYKFRTMKADQYRSSTEKIAGETVVIMTKLDNTEQTLFWAHKGKSLNLSITSTSPRDNLTEFMNAIKPTVRWR